MEYEFKVTQEEADMIITALAELPLKAQPSVFRNRLIVKLQQQAEEMRKAFGV